jgi:hypothetical protein
MCWEFLYKTIDHKGQSQIKEIDNVKKAVELCKEIGLVVPKSIANAKNGNDCLCILTEDDKQAILGKIVLYALDRFLSIEIRHLSTTHKVTH